MSASPSDRYEYGTLFFNYIEEGALRSARTIVPIVVQALGTRTLPTELPLRPAPLWAGELRTSKFRVVDTASER